MQLKESWKILLPELFVVQCNESLIEDCCSSSSVCSILLSGVVSSLVVNDTQHYIWASVWFVLPYRWRYINVQLLLMWLCLGEGKWQFAYKILMLISVSRAFVWSKETSWSREPWYSKLVLSCTLEADYAHALHFLPRTSSFFASVCVARYCSLALSSEFMSLHVELLSSPDILILFLSWFTCSLSPSEDFSDSHLRFPSCFHFKWMILIHICFLLRELIRGSFQARSMKCFVFMLLLCRASFLAIFPKWSSAKLEHVGHFNQNIVLFD